MTAKTTNGKNTGRVTQIIGAAVSPAAASSILRVSFILSVLCSRLPGALADPSIQSGGENDDAAEDYELHPIGKPCDVDEVERDHQHEHARDRARHPATAAVERGAAEYDRRQHLELDSLPGHRARDARAGEQRDAGEPAEQPAQRVGADRDAARRKAGQDGGRAVGADEKQLPLEGRRLFDEQTDAGEQKEGEGEHRRHAAMRKLKNSRKPGDTTPLAVPPVSIWVSPPIATPMPRVRMNGDTRLNAMSNPLTSPTPRPTAQASKSRTAGSRRRPPSSSP